MVDLTSEMAALWAALGPAPGHRGRVIQIAAASSGALTGAFSDLLAADIDADPLELGASSGVTDGWWASAGCAEPAGPPGVAVPPGARVITVPVPAPAG
jgi:hypothetical protein